MACSLKIQHTFSFKVDLKKKFLLYDGGVENSRQSNARLLLFIVKEFKTNARQVSQLAAKNLPPCALSTPCVVYSIVLPSGGIMSYYFMTVKPLNSKKIIREEIIIVTNYVSIF